VHASIFYFDSNLRIRYQRYSSRCHVPKDSCKPLLADGFAAGLARNLEEGLGSAAMAQAKVKSTIWVKSVSRNGQGEATGKNIVQTQKSFCLLKSGL
jgi:hypothetical protein